MEVDYFLAVLALVWIGYASVTDIKKREVPNWLSFSLIAFVLVYRALFSVINYDIMFFVYGLIGLGLFVALGYLFYYGRVFAGGDAKLLMPLGAVLPFSNNLSGNLTILGAFVLLMLVCGSLWGILFSIFQALRNGKKFAAEFKKQMAKNKKFFYLSWIMALFSLVLLFFDSIFFMLTLIVLIFPLLFVYAKSVEESCMIKEISTKKLVEGDWLYNSVKIGGKTIKPDWEGLSSKEVKFLRRYNKKVLVKDGIPFVPGFFFAFIILIFIIQNYGLFGIIL
jgi:Flp pilus assembly protein protease CpaA